ncbi:twin-arginine translocase subunit TatC [Halostagnicola kamekurae]|uniref:Sec-independent protein translocase protein TatC n=1 Tax=Halostagnicola kamekurae TaxID=619731 RepID=A0A1I6NZY0_9EURY|nr:twin-arginine translocase subunit TatC [Halostagnicola kamekurae]SFS33513.1 sec-independent protein translocase protein TatC [Halostagnicola kamekurae]
MSSAVSEDTARAINTGRETIGAVLSSAQDNLQRVFIVFLLGFVGAFYALRVFIWDFLEETARTGMNQSLSEATNIITRTPFEVILLQAKIGMIVGVIVAIPAILYYSRDALRKRGLRSVVPISRWYMAGFALIAFVLFWLGLAYAFVVFFPFTFEFLAQVAFEAGVDPSWGITEFTQFMALLTISFGLAAQLPLVMGVLSYTEIVSYETFRDKWRHAIVAITVFGAVFSPPDPITQIMWALPLCGLYAFSLGLAKVVANIRRRGAAELDTGTGFMKRRVLQFGGVLLGVSALTAVFVNRDGFDRLEESVFPLLPSGLEPGGTTVLESIAIEYGTLGDVAVGLLVALGVGGVILVGYMIAILRSPIYPREGDLRNATDPDEVDFQTLETEDIENVPAQVFLEMDEERALEISRQAMYDDNKAKAEMVLSRFDSLQATQAADGDATAERADAGGTANAAGENETAEEEGGLLSSTAAGMLDPFTEDETTEDDIGGYAYDLAFIFNSLTSKAIYIVGLFMLVLGGTFVALYQGGFTIILAQFVDRVPDNVLAEVAAANDAQVGGTESTTQLLREAGFVIALDPVEVLIFMIKISTILAFLAVLPLVLYWAWPAAKERGLVSGNSRVILVWSGLLLVGFAVGLFLGFYWIAPAVISYLITDAVNNGMEVTYRINSFSWLVIYTTLGVGFLFNIIVTMAMFHVGGIVDYRTMLDRWRSVVVGVFVIAAVASPKGILTMLALATPIALTYVLGLGILYLLTGGGRLFGDGGGGQADSETAAVPE